jgi:hypothetical protein
VQERSQLKKAQKEARDKEASIRDIKEKKKHQKQQQEHPRKTKS